MFICIFYTCLGGIKVRIMNNSVDCVKFSVKTESICDDFFFFVCGKKCHLKHIIASREKPFDFFTRINFQSSSCCSFLVNFKAVVWTDVIQIMIMYGTLILINVKGTIDAGGLSVVIQRNIDSGRLAMPEYVYVCCINYYFR